MARTESVIAAPAVENTASETTPVQHDSFVLERRYDAKPAQVFDCWANLDAKKRWFFCDDWGPAEHTLDFRVGGREYSCTGPQGGPKHIYEAVYQDIVPNLRFVLAYTMTIDDSRISSSLLTVECLPNGNGTLLRLTEQLAVFDARYTVADRKHGTALGLEHLAAVLATAAPN